MNLQIQCPQCSKRFMVHEDLTGKVVECGACDHRFRVSSETIIIERERVYPGEHRNDDFLSRIGKKQSPIASASSPSIAPGPRPHVPDVTAIMPASAGQNIAVVAGLIFFLLYALIFFLGTGTDQVFRDVTMDRRLILGAFVAFLSGGLIIYGAKNWRPQGVLLALVLTASLATLILIRPVQLTPTADPNAALVSNSDPQFTPALTTPSLSDEEELKGLVGYSKVEDRLHLLRDKYGRQAENHLIAIFIENLSNNDFNEIEKFLRDSLSYPNDQAIQRYRRNKERDSLVILSGIELDFDQMVSYCQKLGRPTSYPELRLIQLQLSASRFAPASPDLHEKMIDPSRPTFFAANLDELSSINSARVKDAVRRLATLSPEIERRHEEPIVSQFLQILERETDFETLSFLGQALNLWAPKNQAVGDLVSAKIDKLNQSKSAIPVPLAAFLVSNERPEALAVIDALWSDDPIKWAELYQNLGPIAEDELLEHLQKSPKPLQHSAASILAKVGTAKSLPILEQYRSSTDAELRILSDRAIESIQKR